MFVLGLGACSDHPPYLRRIYDLTSRECIGLVFPSISHDIPPPPSTVPGQFCFILFFPKFHRGFQAFQNRVEASHPCHSPNFPPRVHKTNFVTHNLGKTPIHFLTQIFQCCIQVPLRGAGTVSAWFRPCQFSPPFVRHTVSLEVSGSGTVASFDLEDAPLGGRSVVMITVSVRLARHVACLRLSSSTAAAAHGRSGRMRPGYLCSGIILDPSYIYPGG